MRVNRTFLYAGVFLLTLGGVVVIADLVDTDTSVLADALRLWPLAIIAIGAALVLRRSPAALPAGIAAATLPALVLGGSIAAAPRFGDDCARAGEVPTVVTDRGTFAAPARVSISSVCGSLTIGTVDGNAWTLEADSADGRAPTMKSTPSSLIVDATEDHEWTWFGDELSRLDVALPTSRIETLSAELSLGEGSVDLPGADVGRLELVVNAGRLDLDARAASIDDLAAELNLGAMSIALPSGGDLTGSLTVNGGELLVCSPEDVGVRVVMTGAAGEVTVQGRRVEASRWTSPNYTSAARRADLTVDVNFGALRINPIGGCR